MEYLIPILMFLFPVVVAILDKRAKQRKKAASAAPRPQFPPISFNPAPQPVVRPAPQENAPQENVPRESIPQEAPAPVFRPNLEGQRAIHREADHPTVSEPAPEKLEIDKKKLILYSEILKPKFDA